MVSVEIEFFDLSVVACDVIFTLIGDSGAAKNIGHTSLGEEDGCNPSPARRSLVGAFNRTFLGPDMLSDFKAKLEDSTIFCESARLALFPTWTTFEDLSFPALVVFALSDIKFTYCLLIGEFALDRSLPWRVFLPRCHSKSQITAAHHSVEVFTRWCFYLAVFRCEYSPRVYVHN